MMDGMIVGHVIPAVNSGNYPLHSQETVLSQREIDRFKELTIVIRCKDCKHRPVKPDDYENGFDLEFPDGKCPCQCDDGWYSWYPADNWFCADGERKDGDGDG